MISLYYVVFDISGSVCEHTQSKPSWRALGKLDCFGLFGGDAQGAAIDQ